MNTKELADQLDAEDRLMNRGYTKIKYKHCKGLGMVIDKYSWPCSKCEGKGYMWIAPITK